MTMVSDLFAAAQKPLAKPMRLIPNFVSEQPYWATTEKYITAAMSKMFPTPLRHLRRSRSYCRHDCRGSKSISEILYLGRQP